MTEPNKIEQQLERETTQVIEGIERYHRNKDRKEEAETLPGKSLVERAVAPVAAAIELLVSEVEAGKAGRGRPAVAVAYLSQLEAEPVAYITARSIISAASNQEHTPKTAMAIATLLEEHFEFDQLRSAEPALSNHLENKAKKWTTPHHKRSIMKVGAKAASVSGLQWKQGDKLRLGMKLIELFISETGLVEQQLTYEGKNNTHYRLRLESAHGRCELLEPRFKPMVVPPTDWTSPVSGGYLTRENRADLVTGINASTRDDLFSVDMPKVYQAVNSIQSTAWKINRSVFDVVSQVWEDRGTLGGLPSQDWLPVPPRPESIPLDTPPASMAVEEQAILKEWRKAASQAHDINGALISKRKSTSAKLSLALDLRDEPAIYFPHNMDFRGRIYSLASDLNPQGDDLAKGLLTFSEGHPLGETGGFWLYVHIAGLFGVDKCTYEERVAWVEANIDALLDSALSPLDGQRFWCDADKPWSALAACFELAGFHITGDEYVSHLPIAMDGSCSGLQHLSAMLRDSNGGKSVNLTPTDSPMDIYTDVLNAVNLRLTDSDLQTDQLAQAWVGKVTRIIVKRPCMTFAYSVTSRGMRDQIIDEIRKSSGGGEYLPGYDNFTASNFLAPIVEQAIRNTVDRAAEAMDWLKKSIRPTVELNRPVTWFTPLNFPVAHRYVKHNGKRFNVWFQGTRLQIQLRVETTKQDLRKQQSGIAPNFVHSQDACHLMMVANRMVDEGITADFAMIHDSFGVHACFVDELNFSIRDEFINLYSDSQLDEFRDQIIERLPADLHEEVPAVPAMGTLDLEGIRDAEFFFA